MHRAPEKTKQSNRAANQDFFQGFRRNLGSRWLAAAALGWMSLTANPSHADEAPSVAGLRNVRVAVQFGHMQNHTGVRGLDAADVLMRAAALRGRALSGVVVIDPNDHVLARAARARKIPLLILDGSLTKLAQTKSQGAVQVSAKVEFAVRKEQTLKAVLTGGASTHDTADTLSDSARLTRVQNDVIDAAVESALRNADPKTLAQL